MQNHYCQVVVVVTNSRLAKFDYNMQNQQVGWVGLAEFSN